MMLFYFLIEAIFFLYTSVLPIAAHLVLLPVAFSVSYAAGLDATIQWTLYYWVLGSMRLVLPSFVMAPMAIATPLVALSPIGNILAAAAGQPDKISAQWKFFRMSASTILNHAPAGLALIEGMAAIILIRTLGRRMKEELHGTVRDITGTLLLITYLAAVIYVGSCVWTNGGWDGCEWMIGAVAAAHVLTIAIPMISAPGADDVPVAEGLMLIVYVTLVFSLDRQSTGVSMQHMSEYLPSDTAGMLKVLGNVFPSRAAFLAATSDWTVLVTPTKWPIGATAVMLVSHSASFLTSLATHMPWPTLIRLVARGVILLGATAGVMAGDDDDDTIGISNNTRATLGTADQQPSQQALVAEMIVAIIGKPALIMYYSRIAMGWFDGAPAWAGTEMATLSTGVAIAAFTVMLAAHSAASSY